MASSVVSAVTSKITGGPPTSSSTASLTSGGGGGGYSNPSYAGPGGGIQNPSYGGPGGAAGGGGGRGRYTGMQVSDVTLSSIIERLMMTHCEVCMYDD